MKTTKLTELPEKIKLLYFGREGVGKTTLAASATNGGRTLFINVEGGLKPTALKQWGINLDNLEVWEPDKGKITIDGIKKLIQDLYDDLEEDPNSWFCVVVDSISELVNTLRENATNKRVLKLKKLRPNMEIDEDFVDRDDYATMTNQLRQVIRHLRDLPCHVIFTSLEKNDEEGTRIPAVNPALVTDLLGYVDVALNVQAGIANKKRVVRAVSAPTEEIRAKDRFGVLPEVVKDPSFENIAKTIFGD